MEDCAPVTSLAEFISTIREKCGLSQVGLAKKCNLSLSEIKDIEAGTELFLATTIRQKLAHGLKLAPSEIKKYEKSQNLNLVSDCTMNEIADKILNGEKKIECPRCGELLITRIAHLHDIYDNPVAKPHARCQKCPFQLVIKD